MVVFEEVQDEPLCQKGSDSLLSRMRVFHLAMILIVIAVVWRQVDIFILGLGNTWMNILPNKLFTLLIMVGIFWRYRRTDIGPVLGITRENIKAHLVIGVIVGISMYLVMDALPVIIYGTVVDTSYPLELHIVAMNMLWYQFLFFLCNGLLEEGLFRGLLQNGFREYVGPNRAILFSAMIFGVYHVCWPILNLMIGGFSLGETAGMLIFSGIAGGIFGVYYEKFSSRKSLIGPIVAHTLINFFNENFKIGPETVTQGPDFAFASPTLLGIMALIFLLFASFLIVMLWKLRIEKVQRTWKRMLHTETRTGS